LNPAAGIKVAPNSQVTVVVSSVIVVRVPSVLGVKVAAATNTLRQSQFQVETDELESIRPVGTVINQSSEPWPRWVPRFCSPCQPVESLSGREVGGRRCWYHNRGNLVSGPKIWRLRKNGAPRRKSFNGSTTPFVRVTWMACARQSTIPRWHRTVAS